MKISNEGMHKLCDAIITRAARDYKNARLSGKEHEAHKIMRFFKSDWGYMIFRDLNVAYFTETLKKEVDLEMKRQNKPDYESRLREYEYQKNRLRERNLDPKIYMQKVRDLAKKLNV